MLIKNLKIIFAYYCQESYEGDAYVLAYDKITDKLFEVNGGHCSCYGLEGQWNEEIIELDHLLDRLNKDNYGKWKSGNFRNEICKLLEIN